MARPNVSLSFGRGRLKSHPARFAVKRQSGARLFRSWVFLRTCYAAFCGVGFISLTPNLNSKWPPVRQFCLVFAACRARPHTPHNGLPHGGGVCAGLSRRSCGFLPSRYRQRLSRLLGFRALYIVFSTFLPGLMVSKRRKPVKSSSQLRQPLRLEALEICNSYR